MYIYRVQEALSNQVVFTLLDFASTLGKNRQIFSHLTPFYSCDDWSLERLSEKC